MALCLNLIGSWDQPIIYQFVTAPPGTEYQNCDFVAVTGSEYQPTQSNSGGVASINPLPVEEERIQDAILLFWAFFAVLIVIWGYKQLIAIFNHSSGD